MTPYYKDNHITQFNGHVLDVLPQLPAESVHMCVTSPPYWGLRDYGLPPQIWDDPGGCEHEWGDMLISKANDSNRHTLEWKTGGDPTAGKTKGEPSPQGQFCQICGAWRGSLGLEPTPELYIKHIVQVFREVWRVLRKDATLWLNLGDSYAGGGRGGGGKNENDRWGVPSSKIPSNLKPKDLCGIPWRVALALQADGWYLRSDIIWAKPNPMPESVQDRPTRAHEYVFLLTKAAKYFFDQDAVREKSSTIRPELLSFGNERPNKNYPGHSNDRRRSKKPDGWATHLGNHGSFHKEGREKGKALEIQLGRNLRSVWTIATEPTKECHFATFASKLVEPCIKAGTSEKGCCPECGAAWVRVVESIKNYHAIRPDTGKPREKALIDVKSHKKNPLDGNKNKERYNIESKTIGWKPSCKCGIEKTIPCTVLDPFSGSGKTGIVAKKLGRRAILIELKDEYCKMPIPKLAQERLI